MNDGLKIDCEELRSGGCRLKALANRAEALQSRAVCVSNAVNRCSASVGIISSLNGVRGNMHVQADEILRLSAEPERAAALFSACEAECSHAAEHTSTAFVFNADGAPMRSTTGLAAILEPLFVAFKGIALLVQPLAQKKNDSAQQENDGETAMDAKPVTTPMAPDGYDPETDAQMVEHVYAIYRKEPYCSADYYINATPEERKKLITQFANEVLAAFGNLSVPSKMFGVYAGFRAKYIADRDGRRKAIQINNMYIDGYVQDEDEYKRLLRAVVHEARHAYQHAAIINPDRFLVSSDTLQIWKTEFFSGENHVNQEIEKDARSFSEACIPF